MTELALVHSAPVALDPPTLPIRVVPLRVVVDGEVVQSLDLTGYVSPLQVTAATLPWNVHSLRGGIVTDPAEIEAIRARVASAARPWWKRWGR